MSDLVGFTYSSWPAETAADDFVRRIVEAGARYRARTGGEATVFVVLDGENAWEHFEGQGRPFLRALYGRLASHPELRTVTMAEACADATERLVSIFPGSWINADFYIWIGHADDRRAWGQLSRCPPRARRAAAGTGSRRAGARTRGAADRRRQRLVLVVRRRPPSDHDREFDDLFRRHVRNVYRALELPIPEDLFVTNITTAALGRGIRRPSGLQPEIDGEVTSYFEWLGAGR